MKLSLLPLFLFAAISSTFAAALSPRNLTLQVKESVTTPHGWTRLGRASSDSKIRLRIAIFQQDFAGLEKSLYDISDPDHHRYGAHFSKEEVAKFVAPPPASLALVDGWLTSHGIKESDLVRSPAKDWISVTLPIHLAERILGAEYYMWQHTSGDILYLHEHIELIQPTTMFTRSKGMTPILYPEEDEPLGSVIPVTPFAKPHVDPSCTASVTLNCLMHLYNAVGYKPRATKKNAIGITGFLGQNANTQDLNSFYRDQLPAAANSTFKSVSVYGAINNQSMSAAGEEANLDTQFAFGISYPTPGTFWSTGGLPPWLPDDHTPVGKLSYPANKCPLMMMLSHPDTNEPYLDWLDFVLRSDHIPQTISTSYGDDEATVPFTYATRVCKLFAELGARGVSVLFASGDGGVGDGNPNPATQQCRTNDGKRTRRFLPAFPASCPYVTAVGGTMSIPEVAANFSGGGFSDYFSRPTYQDHAVNAYLSKLHGTYEGLFNHLGRVRRLSFLIILVLKHVNQGIPDVSAQSRKFQIVWQGQRISIGGTSASTPTFAGLVALLNDARLAAGRPALGFLNPLLYKRGEHALNDVVAGANPGCGTPGFNATKGWDPVTGLGTPDFKKLLKVCV
ncbi:Tripeptidyl-peptidase sed3 [Mycena venus]|uniref:tripeptidyl-peptidase II n=1 Tax=Mycena venus TaxID=2733690 RepID=A0A8H6Y4A0_9AGAR|nr:Tripeptidyl-peptidase sed3 [Mycena venus]